MTRRDFLRTSLGLAVAGLVLRFRPERAPAVIEPICVNEGAISLVRRVPYSAELSYDIIAGPAACAAFEKIYADHYRRVYGVEVQRRHA